MKIRAEINRIEKQQRKINKTKNWFFKKKAKKPKIDKPLIRKKEDSNY